MKKLASLFVFVVMLFPFVGCTQKAAEIQDGYLLDTKTGFSFTVCESKETIENEYGEAEIFSFGQFKDICGYEEKTLIISYVDDIAVSIYSFGNNRFQIFGYDYKENEPTIDGGFYQNEFVQYLLPVENAVNICYSMDFGRNVDKSDNLLCEIYYQDLDYFGFSIALLS